MRRPTAIIHENPDVNQTAARPPGLADLMMEVGKPDLDLDIARSSLQVDESQTAFFWRWRAT